MTPNINQINIHQFIAEKYLPSSLCLQAVLFNCLRAVLFNRAVDEYQRIYQNWNCNACGNVFMRRKS